MTITTIILGSIIVILAIVVLAASLIWIDSFYEEQDEHSDTDNSRG